MLVLYMATKLMNAQVPIYSCGMSCVQNKTIISYHKWMQMISNEIVNSLYCPKQYHMRYIFQCNSLPHILESITDACTEIICMNIGVSQYYHMMCIDVRQCLTQGAQNVRQCTFYSSPDILNIKRLNCV